MQQWLDSLRGMDSLGKHPVNDGRCTPIHRDHIHVEPVSVNPILSSGCQIMQRQSVGSAVCQTGPVSGVMLFRHANIDTIVVRNSLDTN